MSKKLYDMIKQHDAKYVDLRFTDTKGKLQHVSVRAEEFNDNLLSNGYMFDGSSIAGWKDIHESDMVLMPDADAVRWEPFAQESTIMVFCDVYDPVKKAPYERDPRSIAKKAEEYLKKTKIGDKAFFGPEPEFFVFDSVTYTTDMQHVSFKLDDIEGPYNTGREFENGNTGHRPKLKGGYFPVPPVDSAQDLRSEMVSTMIRMGVKANKHHHEVATSQHEIGFDFSTLTNAADDTQLYKYVVQNVAHAYGKTATFMPKPMKGDNGSGMHVHQSIWKGSNSMFSGNKYAGLSQDAMYYIGGILKHARALNAITNPTTNSYKRLVPGYEAPVLCAYSYRNRSAACRIPHVHSAKAARMEMRFPDPLCNPYLAYAALLLAGLDGIKNKIDPGKPADKDLYALDKAELAKIPTMCGSLREAVEELDKDRKFLTSTGVFTDDMLDAYIELRMKDIYAVDLTPHPVEYDLYYSL